ncbi:hypothetical protein [Paraburkholderia diazotrophica]|uniref:hypothetical protein n=1 Tax=Paraburkholderia diazotrophica TaxID=667676 RepID=UPI00317559E5
MDISRQHVEVGLCSTGKSSVVECGCHAGSDYFSACITHQHISNPNYMHHGESEPVALDVQSIDGAPCPVTAKSDKDKGEE